MAALREVLEAVGESGGGYEVEVPEGWTTGRTVYGGMTAVLCAHAASLRFPQLPPLRSAQFSFIGPASGTLSMSPEMLREGSSSAVVGVDYRANGRLAARAVFTYGATRESQVHHDIVSAPVAKPVEECTLFMGGDGPSPGFGQFFEHRNAGGASLRGGSSTPEFLVWLRLLDPEGIDPVVALLALADAVPPAAIAVFPSPGPISTMSWHVDFRQPLKVSDWVLVRVTSEHAAAGYSQQSMDIWTDAGERLAMGRQTVAIFV